MHGIDEGDLEIEPYGDYASSLLYCYMHPFTDHGVPLIKK